MNGEKPRNPDEKKRRSGETQAAARGGKVHPKLALLKDVIALMQEAKISELDYEQAGVRIHLKKGGTALPAEPPPVLPPVPAPLAGGMPSPPPAGGSSIPNDQLVTITSPMVGTFYRSPAPDAKPFVQEGDRVQAGRVICIIEAMKLMNEIKAEVGGRVVKILVQNGQAVEFGQPLMTLDPAG